MHRVLGGAIAACGALALVLPAQAVLISFEPTTSTVTEGDAFDVGIRVSGLQDQQDEFVSTFDLDVLIDVTVLSPTGFAFGSALGADADYLGGSGLISLPYLAFDVFQLSFLDNAVLAEAQGDSVLLGLLRFMAIGVGQTALTFGTDPVGGRNIVGSDPFSSLPVDVASATATVLARPVSVPEPATLALLGPGLLALLAYRRRRQVQQEPKQFS